MTKGMLDGLVAVVCGGSGHVGAGISQVLAKYGATVVVQYKSGKQRALKTVSDIQNCGGKASGFMCDALDEESVQSFFSNIEKECGGIDILVNAVHQQAPMKNVSDMEWTDWTPHINAMRTNFYLCKHVLPYIRKSENGRIIYISGGLSKRFFVGNTAYSAVKGGINNFCKTLALEEAGYGTTVNIVAPGRVEPEKDGNEPDEIWEEIDSAWEYKTPISRKVTAVDVGEVAAYFAFPASACITGQTIFAAGGEIIP